MRSRQFEDQSPLEFLLLRERLGIGKYRKRTSRDEEERQILIDLGLGKMKENEKDDFILVGYRRRRLRIH